MGKAGRVGSSVSMLVLSIIALIFSVWCFGWACVYRHQSQRIRRRMASISASSDSFPDLAAANDRCYCLSDFKRMKRPDFVSLLTLLGLLLIVVSLFSRMMLAMYTLIFSIRGLKWSEIIEKSTIINWNILLDIAVGLSWLTITIVGFQRLIITFDHTSFSLSPLLSNMIYVFMGLALSLGMAAIAIGNVFLLKLVGFGIGLCYVLLNLWILVSFTHRTIEIARQLASIRGGIVSSQSPTTPSQTNTATPVSRSGSSMMSSEVRINAGLVNLAVRVGICVSVSILSTFISVIFIVITPIVLDQWNKGLAFNIRTLVVLSDLSINSFGLLCLYSAAIPKYEFVFGKLHSKVRELIVRV